MTSNDDEWTISKLFDSASDLYEKLQSNQIDGTLENYNIALERLKSAEEKLDELHLFSDNEEISEVATNELRYFIIDALIGWLYEFRPSIREHRSDDVQLGIHHYIKYLHLCRNYGLVKEIPNENDEVRPVSQQDRQVKIQKLKEKKTLEQSIAKLRALPQIDDETKRQLYSEQIRLWIRQSEEEINALKDERKLISFAKDPNPPVPIAMTTKPTNQMPISGPFTIVKTKDQLYREAVGGAGYPSLPTMTVQEFYDDLTARQTQQTGSQTNKSTTLTTEQLEEIDDPTHRENVRRMDEFKDENPRGYGNRYNRS